MGGQVAPELTEPLRRHERVMKGTSQASPRCVALDADIGVRSRCTIHPQRPSVCRDVPASWEFGAASPQCDKARIAHGLAPLTPADWHGIEAPANDDDGHPDDNPNDGGHTPPALPPPIAA